MGGFWSIAGGIALRLVPERHVPRATALIFGGVETASVLGVPTGTFVGDLSGWRIAFAAVGLLGLGALVCMIFLLPGLPSERTLTLADLPRVLRTNVAVRAGVTMTFLVITGHFIAYTFVRPILHGRGVEDSRTSLLLLVFGVAGICGNFIAGALAARHLGRAVVGIGLAMTTAMVLLALAADSMLISVGSLVVWGVGYGAVPVTLQTWILRAAPRATEAASSLYVSMFNLSIALGALFGGLAVDMLTLTSVLWIGCGLLLPTLLLATRRPRTTIA